MITGSPQSHKSLEKCIGEKIYFDMYVTPPVGAKSFGPALSSGWSPLCLDGSLVPQLGVPEIGHRQVLGQALVQWQIRMDLPLGVFVVIDTHWVLCYFLATRSSLRVSWQLLLPALRNLGVLGQSLLQRQVVKFR